MYGQFYAGMSLAGLPLFALFLFLAVFVAVVLRVTLLGRRPELDRMARLPLEDAATSPLHQEPDR
jgi:hypothetical protein